MNIVKNKETGNEMVLYDRNEMAAQLYDKSKYIVTNEEIVFVLVDDEGQYDYSFILTCKNIIENDVIFIGNPDVYNNLRMFSYEDITKEDILNVLKDHGYDDCNTFFTFDKAWM